MVVKYSEPPEARIPKRRWRFYVFKGEETLPTLYLHRQSAYLMGRDRKVADIPIDHPSCSKQHVSSYYLHSMSVKRWSKLFLLRTRRCSNSVWWIMSVQMDPLAGLSVPTLSTWKQPTERSWITRRSSPSATWNFLRRMSSSSASAHESKLDKSFFVKLYDIVLRLMS